MNDREKLIMLLGADTCGYDCEVCKHIDNEDACIRYLKESMADHLLANGVTVQKWIPVTERLPENEVDVLICARRGSYKGGFYTHVATAFHTDGKMNTEDSQYNWDIDNADMEYDEEAGAYIVPEGWWEAVRYGEEFSAVDDFVTHWMPLPKPSEDGGAENA